MLEIIGADVPPQYRARWKTEASHWRFPYWDWAAKSKSNGDFTLPLLITRRSVDIITLPQLLTRTVPNPLWQFDNPAGVPMGDPKMGVYALKFPPGEKPDDKEKLFYYV